MSIPPLLSDDVIERAFCDPESIDQAWKTAGALVADGVAIEERAKSPGEALREMVRLLGDRGLLGLVVPGAYGGTFTEIRSVALCLARERLGHASPLLELAFAMQGLGSYPISSRGSEALCAEWLPRVAAGDVVCGIAARHWLASSQWHPSRIPAPRAIAA